MLWEESRLCIRLNTESLICCKGISTYLQTLLAFHCNILKKDYVILTKTDIQSIVKSIKKPAFQNAGILALLESKKNELNPDTGQAIQINGMGTKKGLANLFKNLDNEIIKLLGSGNDEENSHIINFLNEISGKIKTTLF